MPDDGWYSVDDGATLSQIGSERGVIVADEEHPMGARITLERGGETAPFAITCGVYGLLMHTRFFETAAEGEREYNVMKPGLVKVREAGGRDFNAEASAFVARFPT